jgi:hypothetical protein
MIQAPKSQPSPSRRLITVLAFSLAALAGADGLAQAAAPTSVTPPPPTVRMRGTIQAVTPAGITVKDRSGEVVELALSDKLVVTEVYPIALADIQKGSYIGTAALPQPDGTLKAIAVTVFTESQRNVPQGHTPFNLQPQSTMTNAIVEDIGLLSSGAAGRRLQLKYQAGEKTLEVAADVPVVTSRPGDKSLLVAGASVSLFAQMIDGKPTALRVNVGRDRFALPY